VEQSQLKIQIRIKAGSVTAVAELLNTKTAEAIWQALPFSSKVNTWGNEIYFRIPVKIELESGQEVVNSGDLGYWPPGSAFCVFFGPTPVSSQGEIRAASAVDIFGKLADDARVFRVLRTANR
jgi:hypothetical protein